MSVNTVMSRQEEPRRSILMVGTFLGTSGNLGVADQLAARLRGAGWTVLTTSSARQRLTRLADMVGTTVRRRAEYDLAQVDVYSGHAFVWAEAVCQTLQLLGKPFILTLHGGGLPAFAARWPGRVRRLLGAAAAITAPSAYLVDQMRAYGRSPQLLPNPVDLSLYQFRRRGRPSARLVWVRSFHQLYNPQMAVRALALVRRDCADAHLTMVGPDKGDGSLQQTQALAGELGVAANVTFTGRLSAREVAAQLDRADVFLNTTTVDNTPLSVLEAMASGLCVVSTNVGGLPYLLTHLDNALLVGSNDHDAMARDIVSLCGNGWLADRLSARGRATSAGADWTAVLPQWDRLLRETAVLEMA